MAGRTLLLGLLTLFVFRSFHHGSASTRPSKFYRLAHSLGTDKVTSHQYQTLYEKYLEPIKDHSLRLLEVGLGCGMSYGPGVSLQVGQSQSLQILDTMWLAKQGRAMRA